MSEDINVRVLTKTPDPEKVICQAARNDYMQNWVGDTDFAEVMRGITVQEQDREWAEDHFEGKDMGFERNILEWSKRRALIRHLLDHGHYGPFEHPQITFAVEGISRSCMAQITRHRHASFDIQSMRYVTFDGDDIEEACVHPPELTDPALCGRNAEFGAAWESLSDEQLLTYRNKVYWQSLERSFRDYNRLLKMGWAPENARMVLPIGTEVNMVFSVNARMLMHIADMRAAGDAQWEVREMTEQILDLAEDWAPATFSYFDAEMKGRKNRLAP